MQRWIEKAELLDGPFFDRDIGKFLAQRLRRLLSTQEWRDDKERRLAVQTFGKFPCLCAAELRQWIANLICAPAARVGNALTMANKNDSRRRRRCSFGHGLPSGEGVVSLFTRSTGMLAVSTARSLCCSIFAEFISSRKDASGVSFGGICARVCSTDFKTTSSVAKVSAA